MTEKNKSYSWLNTKFFSFNGPAFENIKNGKKILEEEYELTLDSNYTKQQEKCH